MEYQALMKAIAIGFLLWTLSITGSLIGQWSDSYMGNPQFGIPLETGSFLGLFGSTILVLLAASILGKRLKGTRRRREMTAYIAVLIFACLEIFYFINMLSLPAFFNYTLHILPIVNYTGSFFLLKNNGLFYARD